MTATEQRMSALELANQKRIRKAALRRRLASERGALRDVLLNPPPELAHMAIIDVVRMGQVTRAASSMQQLGRLAVRDGVNLLVPLGSASVRTREWAAEHAEWRWYAATSSTRLQVVVS